MKYYLLLLLLFVPFAIMAQSHTPTEQEARDFFDKTDEMLLTRVTVFEEDGELYELYSRKNPGDIVITGTTMSKIIRIGESTLYNCSMIEFNASKQDPKEIERLQNKIIASYNFGIPFEELAQKYATPETTYLDVSFDTDSMAGPRKEGLVNHLPKEMFIVKIGETMSFLMVINSPPTKVKSVTYNESVYK